MPVTGGGLAGARRWPRVMAGSAAALTVAGALVWLLLPPASGSRTVLANLSLFLAPAAALAALWCAGDVARTRAARRSWRLLALGAAAAVLGQASWSVRELVLGTGVPFPSEAFVLFVVFHLLLAASAVVALRAARDRQLALEIALDGLLVLLMAALLGLRYVLEAPVVNGWLSDTQATAMLMGQVATAASTFFVLLLLVWRDTDLPLRAVHGLAGAVVLFLAGNILTAAGLDPRPESGDPVELVWVAGWLMVTAAAFLGIRSPGTSAEPRERAAQRVRHLVIPATVAFLVFTALDAVRRPYFTTTSAILLLVLGVALAGRVVNALRATERQAERRRQAELSALCARVRAMVARLRPHFVLNSLNAVAELVRRGDDSAEESVYRLASLIRYTLEAGEDQLVTLGHELRLTREYLRLERLRMGDRLTVRISVPAGARERQVPPFILQPLVENAVRHGLAGQVGGGTVRVRGRVRDGGLLLEVSDDGVGGRARDTPAPHRNDDHAGGMGGIGAGVDAAIGRGRASPETLRPPVRAGRGIGLRGVRAQLQAHFGDAARMRVRSRPGRGFAVRLWIPDLDD